MLPFSHTKYPTFVCLSLATPLHHLHAHSFLLQHLISPLIHLFLNQKSSRFCLTVLTSNLILIISHLSSQWMRKVVLTITNIVNFSLTAGQFHPILKEFVISPLLKKSTLYKDQLTNYRPISNLSVISKIIERIVKSRLTDHLISNKLLDPHQSAYCKRHSLKLLCIYIHIHNHLINAIGSQKVSCLCILNLFAAFDTIDHILITRLSSWFVIHGSVLSWFMSYLSSPSVLNVITTSFPFILPLVVSPKALFTALYSSSCTLFL